MGPIKKIVFGSFAAVAAATLMSASAFAQQKPNIVVIMGDDIGITNIGVYGHGMMAGKTPNLDKIAKEGMLFTDYYAERVARRVEQPSSPANCRSEPA